MKRSSKIILGITLTISVVAIAVVVLLVVSFADMVTDIKDNLDSKQLDKQITSETYDSIPDELLVEKILSEDYIFVGKKSPWGYKSTDVSRKYYFYINEEKYDEYKHYWLEDIDESDYRDDYNSGLSSYGDYVFKAVLVSDLCYEDDTYYGNVFLEANKTYYLVNIYDEAIYYKYIRESGSKENLKYSDYVGFNVKEESLSAKYIFQKNNDHWSIQEVVE